MKALQMEFFKCKRRAIWLPPLLMLAAQLAWGLWSFRGTLTVDELANGWRNLFYYFPLLNSMMTPVIAAVVASRIADIEHKGQTLKLLETVQPTGCLFDAKFLCGACYMGVLVLVQAASIVITGIVKGFDGAVPLDKIGLYIALNLLITLTIYLLQLVLSLLLQNQLIALIIGLIGSFLGLFSLFFPQAVQRLLLWGYYGVLSFVWMSWDATTRIASYVYVPVDRLGLVILCVGAATLYFIGRHLFARKEV